MIIWNKYLIRLGDEITKAWFQVGIILHHVILEPSSGYVLPSRVQNGKIRKKRVFFFFFFFKNKKLKLFEDFSLSSLNAGLTPGQSNAGTLLLKITLLRSGVTYLTLQLIFDSDVLREWFLHKHTFTEFVQGTAINGFIIYNCYISYS